MNSHSISALSKHDAYSDMFYVPSFHFDPVKPCYYQSGKVFGQCCGGHRENVAMPRGIQVLKGFLSNVECKRFTRFADKQKRAALSVVDANKTTSNKTTHKRHNSRITQTVALGKKQQQASEWFYSVCSTKLEALTGKKPQWFDSALTALRSWREIRHTFGCGTFRLPIASILSLHRSRLQHADLSK